MYLCMFAYSCRKDIQIRPILGMFMPWNQEENLESSKLRKSVLGSSTGECGYCSSETKQHRKTASNQKLFVSKRRLQEQRPQPRKQSRVWVPVKMISVAQKLCIIEKRLQDQSCLFRRGDYRNKGQNPQNLSWVWVPLKLFFVAQKLSMIEQHQDQSCLFWQGDYNVNI
jgi:hypothetical protein